MSITAKQYADAIREARGIVSVAARRLGCTRPAIYAAKNKYVSVGEAFDEAREAMTDFTEGKLYKKINDEDAASIFFYLKTQGKKRGYVEKVQVEHVIAQEVEAMLEAIGALVDGATYDAILAGLSERGSPVTSETSRALN